MPNCKFKGSEDNNLHLRSTTTCVRICSRQYGPRFSENRDKFSFSTHYLLIKSFRNSALRTLLKAHSVNLRAELLRLYLWLPWGVRVRVCVFFRVVFWGFNWETLLCIYRQECLFFFLLKLSLASKHLCSKKRFAYLLSPLKRLTTCLFYSFFCKTIFFWIYFYKEIIPAVGYLVGPRILKKSMYSHAWGLFEGLGFYKDFKG